MKKTNILIRDTASGHTIISHPALEVSVLEVSALMVYGVTVALKSF